MNDNEFLEFLKRNDIAGVISGLEEKPERINAQYETPNGNLPPIHIAAEHGHGDLVFELMARGAEPNDAVQYRHPSTALDIAYINHEYKAAEALKKFDVNYDPVHLDREIAAFKASMVENLDSLESYYSYKKRGYPDDALAKTEAKKDLFDRYVDRIKSDPKHFGKLAKRIPKETLDGKEINPEFIAFAEVLQKAHKAKLAHARGDASFNTELVPEWLERTKGSWKNVEWQFIEFIDTDIQYFHKAVKAFTEHVVLPEAARQMKHVLASKSVQLSEIMPALQYEVAKVLIADRPLTTMLDLARDWQADKATLEKHIPDSRAVLEWKAFAEDYTASNGLTISFITNSKALDTLGKDHGLYVGGYAEKCMKEPAHIGLVKRGDTVVSAFELLEDAGAKKRVHISQHVRPHYEPILDNAPENLALKEFQSAVHKKTIPVDFKGLAAARAKRVKEAEDIRFICGFDCFADDAAQRETHALQQYLGVITGGRKEVRVVEGDFPVWPSVVKSTRNAFVPGGKDKWGQSTAKEFLEKTGLMDKIKQLAANPPLAATPRWLAEDDIALDEAIERDFQTQIRSSRNVANDKPDKSKGV